jgi:hypothetical protein
MGAGTYRAVCPVMRTAWWLAAAVLVAGCEAETGGLGATSGPLDAGARVDAGPVVDAGPAADAGPPVDGGTGPDAGGLACPGGPGFGLSVEGWETESFEGAVRVSSLAGPVILTREAGGAVALNLSGEVPAGWARLGEPLYARLEINAPFWVEVRLTLWALGADGGPAELRMMAWSGGAFGVGVAGDVRYAYGPGECFTEDESCGRTRAETLSVVAVGVTLSAAQSQGATEGGLQIFNGRSDRFVEGPFCTDTPSAWYAGWLIAQPPLELDCAALARDVCITDPRCILWGSELRDPGYVCVPVASACEAHATPETCLAGDCVWDPGECYCPEGVECACAGGPAPKCRDFCGGLNGSFCGVGRYCDSEVFGAPGCLGAPDTGGLCERVPDDCRGTPPSPVCACIPGAPMGAVTYADDCLRRQALNSGMIPGACP